MKFLRNWRFGVLTSAALLTAALLTAALSSAVVYAQRATATPTPEEETTTATTTTPAGPRGGRWADVKDETQTKLAEVLGITVEELEAAHTAAWETQIAAAVEAGTITQEQADFMLENGRGMGHWIGNDSEQSYLAEALDITLEELQAAHEQVWADTLAAAVAADEITQEQADLLTAQRAVADYGRAQAQAEYAAELAAAVEAGAITQEQADLLLANAERGLFGMRNFGMGLRHGFGFGDGFGKGHGMGHDMGHGMGHGMGYGMGHGMGRGGMMGRGMDHHGVGGMLNGMMDGNGMGRGGRGNN
jgi:hypothetical protein